MFDRFRGANEPAGPLVISNMTLSQHVGAHDAKSIRLCDGLVPCNIDQCPVYYNMMASTVLCVVCI